MYYTVWLGSSGAGDRGGKRERDNEPLLASYLIGIPQAANSLVSALGTMYVKATPSGKASPALIDILNYVGGCLVGEKAVFEKMVYCK